MLEVVMDSDKVITACFSWEKVKGGLNVDEIMEEVKGSRRIDTKEILEEVKRMRKDPGKLDINAIMQDVQTQGSSTTTYHIMEDVTRKGRRKQ
jgi:hypothetical protein